MVGVDSLLFKFMSSPLVKTASVFFCYLYHPRYIDKKNFELSKHTSLKLGQSKKWSYDYNPYALTQNNIKV